MQRGMEKQIVNHILISDKFKSISHHDKKIFGDALLSHLQNISDTAKELGINIDELWRTHIRKYEYNQLDTREPRHILQNSNVSNKTIVPNSNLELSLRNKSSTPNASLKPINNTSSSVPITTLNNKIQSNVGSIPIPLTYKTQEEKQLMFEAEKRELQIQHEKVELETVVNGYDVASQSIRQMDNEREYLLAIFSDEADLNRLSSMVPPYIKIK